MRTFIFGQVGVDLFDSVLVQKGHSALVERGRQVTDSGGKSKQLGRMLTKPLSRFSTVRTGFKCLGGCISQSAGQYRAIPPHPPSQLHPCRRHRLLPGLQRWVTDPICVNKLVS
jgi:hypothetical protein